MVQHASTIDKPADGTAPMACQQCGEESLGQPFYPMRDTIRNATGEFIPKREPAVPSATYSVSVSSIPKRKPSDDRGSH